MHCHSCHDDNDTLTMYLGILLWVVSLATLPRPGLTQGERALQYNILEELAPDDFIANILLDAQLDLKHSPNDLRLLMFSLHERRGSTLNLKDYFAIEERTGILRTARRIDRETICPHQVQCAAYLNVMVQPGQFFEIISVTINILDLNDNTPTFPRNMVECNVSETSMVGMQIPLPSAEDLDSPGFTIHKYQLLSDTSKFELQVTNNSIGNVDLSLILKEKLDRETEENYLMEVIAVDGGDPPKSGAMMVKVNVLDANDNNPKFDNYSYEVTISENLPVGSTIIQLHAHDPDKGLNGKVEYKFDTSTQADYGGLFGIDNETGEIFIKGPIDYERGDSYTLSVTATDKGPNSLPAYAKVTVHVEDMNDHSPHITVNALTTTGYVEVAEDAQIGTFVAHVSVQDFDSGDAGEFRCRMDSVNFDLQKLYPTEFKIITKTTFDREQQAEYHLNMVCRDRGEPPRSATEHIIVTIVDANDHSPQFQHQVYTAEMRENNAVGAFITQVVALDRDIGKNAEIKYSIADDDRGLLAINEDTGIIRANVRFDYEQDQELEFVVEARDQGTPSRTARALLRLIIIDSNDEVPQFTQKDYRFSVIEDSHARTFVGIVSATDKDASPYNQITYSLDPDFDGLRSFDINAYTGEITTKRSLDREEQSVFHLMVIASNEGFPLMRRKVNVTVLVVDVNDNPPILDFPNEWNHTVHISRSLPVGGYIARIRAHDADEGKNSELSYAFFDGNGGKYFFMNSTTGIVTLSKVLDSEGFQYHSTKVVVKDHGTPPKEALGDFHIIVNKSLPIVQQYQNSGFSFFKLKDSQIIIGAIIVIFVLLVLVLTVIVVKCKRKRNTRNNKYNCRREAKKRDGKKKDPHRESLEWKAVPNDWNGTDMKDGKPKKAVTFRMEVEEGEVEDDHHLWPPNIDSDSTQVRFISFFIQIQNLLVSAILSYTNQSQPQG